MKCVAFIWQQLTEYLLSFSLAINPHITQMMSLNIILKGKQENRELTQCNYVLCESN